MLGPERVAGLDELGLGGPLGSVRGVNQHPALLHLPRQRVAFKKQAFMFQN